MVWVCLILGVVVVLVDAEPVLVLGIAGCALVLVDVDSVWVLVNVDSVSESAGAGCALAWEVVDSVRVPVDVDPAALLTLESSWPVLERQVKRPV